MDHLVYYASRKLSTAERNYTKTERSPGNGLFSPKVQALFIRRTIQILYRPFRAKILGKKPLLEGIVC